MSIQYNWENRRIGDVCDILDSKRRPVTKKDRIPGPYPYYGATGVLDYVNDYIFDEELVLVGEDGADWTTGASTAYKVKGKCWINNHAHVLRPKRSLLLDDWLVYYLNISDLSDYITGATVKKLNQAKLKQIEIPLPPLDTQKKIVAKIEGLMEKIKEAKKLRAEAQGDASNLLPSALHQVFEEGGKEGWKYKEIKDICELNPKKSELNEKDDNFLVSFIPMSAVNEYSQKIESYKEKLLNEVKKGYTYFKEGDVLFAKITPCMENGKIALAENLKNGIGFGTTEFHVLRPKDEVLSKWIYQIIRRESFRREAQKFMTGSAGQKRIPKEYLEKIKIPLPPLERQKEIVNYLDSLSEKTRQIQDLQAQTAAELNNLEQSILHQAFSGELL